MQPMDAKEHDGFEDRDDRLDPLKDQENAAFGPAEAQPTDPPQNRKIKKSGNVHPSGRYRMFANHSSALHQPRTHTGW